MLFPSDIMPNGTVAAIATDCTPGHPAQAVFQRLVQLASARLIVADQAGIHFRQNLVVEREARLNVRRAHRAMYEQAGRGQHH